MLAAPELIALPSQRHPTTQPLSHCPANTGRRILKHPRPIGLRQLDGLFGDADETAGALQASGFEQYFKLIEIKGSERGVDRAVDGVICGRHAFKQGGHANRVVQRR